MQHTPSAIARRRRWPRYLLETLLAAALYGLFRLLPLDAASWMGGRLARVFGPWLKPHRIASANLRRCFPEWDDARHQQVLSGMWENLGRTVGEFPHLTSSRLQQRITLVGGEHLRRESGVPVLFVAGHLGNWELAPYTAYHAGLPLALIYRPANNPLVDAAVCAVRRRFCRSLFGKGTGAAREMVQALTQGVPLGMLVDQKLNEGVEAPFFGMPAMTSPAVAQFALRYGAEIIAARVVRLKGAHFRVEVWPAQRFTASGDKSADVQQVLGVLHRQLEAWIREYPEQWFWVHRRWPREAGARF